MNTRLHQASSARPSRSCWQLTGFLFTDGFESADACLWSAVTGDGC